MTIKEWFYDNGLAIGFTLLIASIVIASVLGIQEVVNDATATYESGKANDTIKCQNFCSPQPFYFENRMIGSDVCLCKEAQ
ncbi:hypothetical protein M0R04_11010 [Candidatus Dojkabacteria bacterium]|jgi:hypothetical protein|nr:hypothetical protein [Candidatus Dojkabacteria bacterium]